MSLQPIRDFIVVSIIKEDEKTHSGLLYKPSTVDEKIVNGTVMETGSGHLTSGGSIVPLEVAIGDRILFNKQMSVEIKHNGETMHLLREEHVLSIVR